MLVFLAMLACLPAAWAQSQNNFWQDSTKAAADQPLDSRLGPIILDNALKLAEAQDKDGQRPDWTRMQMMLAYFFLDQFEIFKTTYGLIVPKTFDDPHYGTDLKGYIATATKLAGTYYDRWQQSPSGDDAYGPAALDAAQRFADVEVDLKRQLSPDDSMGLADALVTQALIFRHLGDSKGAVAGYREALDIFAASRRDHDAIENVDSAFIVSMSDEGADKAGKQQSSGRTKEDFAASPAEFYLPIAIMTAMVADADDAITTGNESEARPLADLIVEADMQGDPINQFMLETWPCQPDLARVYYWRAVRNRIQMKFAAKFEPSAKAQISTYFDQARGEYIKALAVSVFSAGSQGEEFLALSKQYLDFLAEAGHGDQVAAASAQIKSIAPNAIGSSEPAAWQKTLDCTAR